MRIQDFVVAAVAVGYVGMVWVGAGTAHAAPVGDTSPSFSGPAGDQNADALWVDISVFANGTVEQDRSLALTVCSRLSEGMSEGEVIAAGAQHHEDRIADVRFVVHASEWHFCPRYY